MVRGRQTVVRLFKMPGQQTPVRTLKVPGGTRRASRKISADSWFRKRGNKGKWW